MAKLVGLRLKGSLEPSDTLVDLYCQMFEDNRIRWLEWSSFTTKDQEVMGVNKDSTFLLEISAMSVKAKAQAPDLEAQLGSEIKIRFALQRRGLAMDQAGLLEFSAHDLWVDRLIEARLKAPTKGYSSVTVSQLMKQTKCSS